MKFIVILTFFVFFSLEISGKSVVLNATAYSLKGKTRSGKLVKKGYIAADLKKFPFGTKIKLIAGKYSGIYTVEDSGSAIKGNKIDIWLPSKKECLKFGKKTVIAIIL